MEIDQISLPVEIWTAILLQTSKYDVSSAASVCRSFSHILASRILDLHERHIAVWTDTSYAHEPYLQEFYQSTRIWQWGIESTFYNIAGAPLSIHKLTRIYYYPLNYKLDGCLLITRDLNNYAMRWGFDWKYLRQCLLMNVPITIAITAAADSPISEQNFNAQATLVHNYIKKFNGILNCNVTIVPLMLNTSPQKCQSYMPWYDGPDLASALSTITRNGALECCVRVSLKVGDKLDSLFGKFTVHSIKCRGEYINRAIYGEEIELGFNPPAVGLSTKNPSLHPYGVLSPNIKPVKEIRAIVSVYRNHVRKGMRNGIITVIQIWGSKKILCKIEVEKMLEDSQQLYQRRMNSNPPEKYYYSQYDCFRKTLDRGVLGLVKITPRAEDELMYAMPQSESADLSRFYITDSSLVVGLGVVLKCA